MTLKLYLAAAFLSLGAAFAPASAQTSGEDPVAQCRAAHASDAQARIICLETAIQGMRGQVVQAEQQAAEAQAQAAASQAQVQAAASAERARPSWSIPGFRAAQEASEPTQVRVQLARIRYGRDGYGFFTTADGQVWRETVAAPARRRLDPEESYEAEIRRTPLGFRMLVDGIRWEYKVEPLN
jgi:multidrug resistance efflux pump